VPPADAATSDRGRARLSAAILGVVYTAAMMAYSLLWNDVVHGHGWWRPPGDIWVVTRAASFVQNGALGYIYSSVKGFFALPLIAIVLAPAMALCDRVGLVSGAPYPVPHPTQWLVVGPALYLCGIPVLHAGRRLAHHLGARRQLLGVQLALVAVVLVPLGLWGHPEDLLAVACTMYAIRRVLRGEWDGAALWFALAIGMKQWSVLAIPFVAVRVPEGRRARFLACSLGPAVALAAFPLVVDWRHASQALVFQRTPLTNTFGHRSPLVALFGARASLVGRGTVLLAAPTLAVLTRRRTGPAALLACLCVIFIARAFLEPLFFGYYLAPGLGLLIVLGAAAERRWWLTAAVVVPWVIWSLQFGGPTGPWWGLELTGLVIVSAYAAWLAVGSSLPPVAKTSQVGRPTAVTQDVSGASDTARTHQGGGDAAPHGAQSTTTSAREWRSGRHLRRSRSGQVHQAGSHAPLLTKERDKW